MADNVAAEVLALRGELAEFKILMATAFTQVNDRLIRIEITLNTLVDTIAAHLSDGHGGQA